MQTPEYSPLTVGDWIVTKIMIMAACVIGLMIVAMIALGGFTAIMSHAMQQQGHVQ